MLSVAYSNDPNLLKKISRKTRICATGCELLSSKVHYLKYKIICSLIQTKIIKSATIITFSKTMICLMMDVSLLTAVLSWRYLLAIVNGMQYLSRGVCAYFIIWFVCGVILDMPWLFLSIKMTIISFLFSKVSDVVI